MGKGDRLIALLVLQTEPDMQCYIRYNGNALKHDANFFIEHFALDLLMSDDGCVGVLAFDIEQGEYLKLKAKNTILATGGYEGVISATRCAYMHR